MEAADALCPRRGGALRQGGEALEAAISQDLHRTSTRANRKPEIRPDAWLTATSGSRTLLALLQRPDLQLTGREPAGDPLAPRIPAAA